MKIFNFEQLASPSLYAELDSPERCIFNLIKHYQMRSQGLPMQVVLESADFNQSL